MIKLILAGLLALGGDVSSRCHTYGCLPLESVVINEVSDLGSVRLTHDIMIFDPTDDEHDGITGANLRYPLIPVQKAYAADKGGTSQDTATSNHGWRFRNRGHEMPIDPKKCNRLIVGPEIVGWSDTAVGFRNSYQGRLISVSRDKFHLSRFNVGTQLPFRTFTGNPIRFKGTVGGAASLSPSFPNKISHYTAESHAYYCNASHYGSPQSHCLLTIQIILVALIGTCGLFYFTRAILIGECHPTFGGYLILGIAGIACGAIGSIAMVGPLNSAYYANNHNGE